ncbi:DNA mismatch repair endonuclease MutL [Pirellulales bacterium]|nr:DNA mismatch repair endonuclease MutL [Pirellulales bacterium]
MTHTPVTAQSRGRTAICQLPPIVVNQIAAGEVIERPASVVKELVENALDARALRIDVAIEKGGGDLIRVSDNGCGVPADELTLALASHATSKIRDAHDLFRVATLGFRGEALASIASVSRLTFRSRPQGAEAAAELESVGGRAEQVRPAGGPCGTLVEVRQLFFNTPVRKKFLRTTQTETGHISEAITRVALAHPHVHFTLTHGTRTVYDLPPAEGLPERVAALFGEDIAAALIPVEALDDDLQLSGYVANPTHSRGSNRMQYLLLNGRFIRDRSLQHALGEAYRGLLLTGRYPICFMNIEMPAEAVDVNIHPTKLEVRFQDGGRVYSQLLSALRTKFLSTDLVARPNALVGDAEGGGDAVAEDLVRWAQQQLRPAGTDATPSFRPFVAFPESESRGPLQLHPIPTRPAGRDRFDSLPADLPPTLSRPPIDEPARGLQIHNRYLVVENEDGLEVIDQHALHERILYEALREKVLAGELESQKLLVPEPVDVAADEAAAVLDNRKLLGQLGVDVEPFGGETVLVSSYPAMLANLSPAEVLRSLIEQLLSGGKQPEPRDLLDDLMHMIACKAAVKYGDRLEPQEISELLRQRLLVRDHHHCPHGRPTALVFTRDQLDRQFQRT